MIYILDSLGGKHPETVENLSKWLDAEALDKHSQVPLRRVCGHSLTVGSFSSG